MHNVNTLPIKVEDRSGALRFLLEAFVKQGKQYWTTDSMIMVTNQKKMRYHKQS